MVSAKDANLRRIPRPVADCTPRDRITAITEMSYHCEWVLKPKGISVETYFTSPNTVFIALHKLCDAYGKTRLIGIFAFEGFVARERQI